MKTIKLLLLAIVLSISMSYSLDPIKIEYYKDELDDTEMYSANYSLVVSDVSGETGFVITPFLVMLDRYVTMTDIIVQTAGIGRCNEENTLIIRFTNGRKYTIFSWNKFNCESTSYFKLSDALLEDLSKYPIDVIRFSNGYTHDSYTNKPSSGRSTYFIELIRSMGNHNTAIKNKSK